MKHLKAYNETYKEVKIDHSFTIEPGLNITDENKNYTRNREVFTKHEITKIKQIFSNKRYELSWPGFVNPKLIWICNPSMLISSIIKCEDEWFYVEYKDRDGDFIFYECDQFEELIECLYNIRSDYERNSY